MARSISIDSVVVLEESPQPSATVEDASYRSTTFNPKLVPSSPLILPHRCLWSWVLGVTWENFENLHCCRWVLRQFILVRAAWYRRYSRYLRPLTVFFTATIYRGISWPSRYWHRHVRIDDKC